MELRAGKEKEKELEEAVKGRVMAFPGLALPDCGLLHFLIFFNT